MIELYISEILNAAQVRMKNSNGKKKLGKKIHLTPFKTNN